MESQHRDLLPALRACLAHAEAAGLAGAASSFGPGRLHLSGAGDFIIGGPRGDNGLSGKKLVVDHYGPSIPIGGMRRINKRSALKSTSSGDLEVFMFSKVDG